MSIWKYSPVRSAVAVAVLQVRVLRLDLVPRAVFPPEHLGLLKGLLLPLALSAVAHRISLVRLVVLEASLPHLAADASAGVEVVCFRSLVRAHRLSHGHMPRGAHEHPRVLVEGEPVVVDAPEDVRVELRDDGHALPAASSRF